MLTKILIALAAVMVLAGGLWRLEYLAKQNANISTDLKTAQANLIAANEAAAKVRAELEIENQNRADHLAKLRAIENENQSYRDCVAAGTCGVRIVRANCPAMPKANGSSGTDPGAPVIAPDIQQNILDLRAGILKLEADYSFCQKTLAAWAGN
jgi:hypothetical protein